MFGSTFVIATIGAVVIAQGAHVAPVQVTPPAQQATAPPATASASRPTLQIGGMVIRPDETRKGWAGNGGEGDFEGYVWGDADLCSFGADGKEPTTAPYVGWYMKGHVVSKTADGLAAQIDWQRVWDKGARVTDGPRGSMQVSMRNGATLQLDVATPVTNRCNTFAMRLEAMVADRAEWLTLELPRHKQLTLVPFQNAKRARAGGDQVVGRGTGRSGTGATGLGAARGSGAGDLSFWNFRAAGGAVTSTERFDIEIWLVHTPANGAETAQRIALQAVQGGARFAFPLVPVQSGTGQVNLEFTGNVSVVVTNAGQDVVFNLSRRILVNGTGQTSHSGVKRTAMPAPTEVTSFELPALTDAERAIVGDQRFSIRIKIGKSVIGTGKD